MKEKKLLIVERSKALLEQVHSDVQDDSIVLTGLFTSFDTKNRNGRIYESADFLPHVEALREQIEAGRLMGELDHPHGFEISLKNVSHVVESLEFDPQKNAVVGKIRLLNTSAGREAQALVEGRIPLSISSRAAGTVGADGKVKLQQLFTYDLVADPGFANAQLKRVNESYGFGEDDSIDIYDITEDANTNLDPNVIKTADQGAAQAEKNEDILKNTNMANDNKEFIQYADFQKYTEHLADVVGELQSAVDNIKSEMSAVVSVPTHDSSKVDNSQIADLIAKVGELENIIKKPTNGAPVIGEQPAADNVICDDCDCECECNNDNDKINDIKCELADVKEHLANVTGYAKYLAEMVDKSIIHQDYIANETNKIIEHNNYLSESMNKMIAHQDYLAENMNKMIAHQDYLAENINDTISYQNYLAENLDKHIDYTDMLSEEQNKSNSYQDYLAEKMSGMMDVQDNITEKMEQMIEHQDYICEEVNKMGNGVIVENTNINTEKVAESIEVEEKPTFDSKSYQAELNEKLSTLIKNAKTQYEERKAAEADAIAESKRNVDTTNFNLINYMPARLVERWSNLSDERKKEILAESKMFVISNQAGAEYFWNTRDMRDKQIPLQKIDESVVANTTPVNENVIADERLKAMSERIKRNMRKY